MIIQIAEYQKYPIVISKLLNLSIFIWAKIEQKIALHALMYIFFFMLMLPSAELEIIHVNNISHWISHIFVHNTQKQCVCVCEIERVYAVVGSNFCWQFPDGIVQFPRTIREENARQKQNVYTQRQAAVVAGNPPCCDASPPAIPICHPIGTQQQPSL